MLRRESLSVDYSIPEGWHRATICEDEDEDDYDPWFSFIQGLAFGVEENFDAFDAGLLTFLFAGPGEEWRLVDLGETGTEGWRVEEGWEEVDLQVDNMMEFMPRMGYLFSDGVFDLERVAQGKQKFVLKHGEEAVTTVKEEKRKYKEFKYCMKAGDEWLGVGEGFEDVELTDGMIGDLGVHPEFQKEVQTSEKKIVGKI